MSVIFNPTPGEWTIVPPDDGDDSVGLAPAPGTIVVEAPPDAEGGDDVVLCTMHEPGYTRDPYAYANEPDGGGHGAVDGFVEYGDLASNMRLMAAAPKMFRWLERHAARGETISAAYFHGAITKADAVELRKIIAFVRDDIPMS